jgi:hypothetical protein
VADRIAIVGLVGGAMGFWLCGGAGGIAGIVLGMLLGAATAVEDRG